MDKDDNVKGRLALFALNEYLIASVDPQTRTDILDLVEKVVVAYIAYSLQESKEMFLKLIDDAKKDN